MHLHTHTRTSLITLFLFEECPSVFVVFQARALLVLSVPGSDTGDRFLGQLCDYISRAEQREGRGGAVRGGVTPLLLVLSPFLCCDWPFPFNHRAETAIGLGRFVKRTYVRRKHVRAFPRKLFSA